MAASKNLSRLWGKYVLAPGHREISINHLAPNLCENCHKDKDCHYFSRRIEDSPTGRIVKLDFKNLEQDIVEVAQTTKIHKELTDEERSYVSNPNDIICDKVKYYILVNLAIGNN